MTAFKRNLIVGYGSSLLLLMVSAVASYFSIHNLLESAHLVNRTNNLSKKVESVLSILTDAETGQRGYLLTGDEVFLDPYKGASEKAINIIDDLHALGDGSPTQTADINALRNVTLRRLSYLAELIERKRHNEAIPDSFLLIGKQHMDNARALVKSMQKREETLLGVRTEAMNRFASYTPILVLIASMLAIIVTIISFMRVMKDLRRRNELQEALHKKEEEMTLRLQVIKEISQEISAGNYKIKLDEKGNDNLSGIATSLNAMASSLDHSFNNLREKEWLQKGVASLNDIMIGDHNLNTLSASVIEFVTEYSGSVAGAFYVLNEQGEFELQAGYALSDLKNRQTITPGEGLAGQAIVSAKILAVSPIEKYDYNLSLLPGEIKPRSVIAIPLLFNKTVKGIIELASLDFYTGNTRDFFEAVSFNTGIAINTVINRRKLQEFLEETQSQAEELQAQHNELENINAELEAQAEKLQASEEELKVQQEELQQANQELEERSRLLEEKNELILERNLEIQAKAEELEQSTKYKSEFLANMSHELRTPLNSILLLSRLLYENHENNLSPDQVEYASVIQSSGKGLLTLIDEILDLSKIEAGKMELDYSDISLASITSDLKSLFHPLANEKQIEFLIEIAQEVPGTIEVDKLRLEQVLRNLISNALKFTKEGFVKLQVSKNDKSVLFSVIDTGIGIPRSKQHTIFEAFQQADGSTRRQFGGTGLGLSISRELARLMGGTISLYSEEGKGSEFTLELPLNKPVNETPFVKQEPVVESGDEKSEVLTKQEQQFISPVIPAPLPDDRDDIKEGDKSILIIEDDTNFAGSLLNYTRTKGYKGIVAVRGDEGILLAKQFLPRGILLDIQLPVKSGWQVMDELKSDPATKPIPVHIMSSHQAKTKSISKGAIDFISKPVAFEKLGEMFTRIEEALSKHPKKVLIVEENPKHAQALAYFLQNYNVASEIKNSVDDGIRALNKNEIDCVILDMGIPALRSYETLEAVKKTPGLENLPIIIFTGKNLSATEELKIRQYADSIVIKTAHSYQRILDEVSLFLHLVEENKREMKSTRYKKLGEFEEVLKGKTILVADDDVRNIFSVTKSLENYGMIVVPAIDGKDALEQLEARPKVDLVLMDMMMPEMDGYESTRRIREIPRYRNLPVIAVTAKAMTGDREKCIAAGASDYITKPVDVDQLLSLLRVWLYQ